MQLCDDEEDMVDDSFQPLAFHLHHQGPWRLPSKEGRKQKNSTVSRIIMDYGLWTKIVLLQLASNLSYQDWGSCNYCARDIASRKHVPCFYQVIETWVEVWEIEKCCGNMSHRQVFPQHFQVLPNLETPKIETRRTRFLFFF